MHKTNDKSDDLKGIDLPELVKRFNESESMARLSDKDKMILLTAVAEGDEIAIKELHKLLETEVQTNKFFDEQVEQISEEIATRIVKTFTQKKLLRNIRTAERKDRKTAEEILKSLK